MKELYAAHCHEPCTGRCARSVRAIASESLAYVAECRAKMAPDWNGRCVYQSIELDGREKEAWGLDTAETAAID